MRSPAAWPIESLTCLKRSRSRNSTATLRLPRRARMIAWPRRSLSSVRFGKPGQRVVVGEVAQLLLGALAVGDVVQYADEMRARAGRIAHFGQFEPAQELLVVLAPLPELAAPMAVALERFAHRDVVLGRVLRAVEQRGDAADDLVLAPAGHARERGVDRDEAELEIGHRQRFGHAADDFLRDAVLAVGRARRHDVARGAAHAQRAGLSRRARRCARVPAPRPSRRGSNAGDVRIRASR